MPTKRVALKIISALRGQPGNFSDASRFGPARLPHAANCISKVTFSNQLSCALRFAALQCALWLELNLNVTVALFIAHFLVVLSQFVLIKSNIPSLVSVLSLRT
jgi:hypothetical protein